VAGRTVRQEFRKGQCLCGDHRQPSIDSDVLVNDNKMVEYNGRLYNLSGFTKNFMPIEMQNASHAYRVYVVKQKCTTANIVIYSDILFLSKIIL